MGTHVDQNQLNSRIYLHPLICWWCWTVRCYTMVILYTHSSAGGAGPCGAIRWLSALTGNTPSKQQTMQHTSSNVNARQQEHVGTVRNYLPLLEPAIQATSTSSSRFSRRTTAPSTSTSLLSRRTTAPSTSPSLFSLAGRRTRRLYGPLATVYSRDSR